MESVRFLFWATWLARGGRSTRGNVVASCKECNNKKKLLTPAEQLLFAQKAVVEESD